MALAELGRFARVEAHILCGRLEAEGIGAVAFDAEASIADGSAFLIPVRVMVEEEDLDVARRLLDSLPEN